MLTKKNDDDDDDDAKLRYLEIVSVYSQYK